MYTLLFLYLFYLGFALSVSIYRIWLKGGLNIYNKILFSPVLATFIALDVLINFIVLIPIMGIFPPGCYTISDRFAAYNKGSYGWKTTLATFVCDKLLDTVDPSGNHC